MSEQWKPGIAYPPDDPRWPHNQSPVELQAALTEAVKREWGGSGVDSREPYITNGASRAVYAVLAELRKRGLLPDA
jgi:aspartate/methionine/tyrosine aminotransferase